MDAALLDGGSTARNGDTHRSREHKLVWTRLRGAALLSTTRKPGAAAREVPVRPAFSDHNESFQSFVMGRRKTLIFGKSPADPTCVRSRDRTATPECGTDSGLLHDLDPPPPNDEPPSLPFNSNGLVMLDHQPVECDSSVDQGAVLFPLRPMTTVTLAQSPPYGGGPPWSPEARSATTEISMTDLTMCECIGRGGFSHVWKAIRRTPMGDEVVAVKKLILTVNERADRVRDALIAEATVNAGLMHKHIVMFIGVSLVKIAKRCTSYTVTVTFSHRSLFCA